MTTSHQLNIDTRTISQGFVLGLLILACFVVLGEVMGMTLFVNHDAMPRQ